MPTTDDPPSGPTRDGSIWKSYPMGFPAQGNDALEPFEIREVKFPIKFLSSRNHGTGRHYCCTAICLSSAGPVRLDMNAGAFSIPFHTAGDTGPWKLQVPWNLQVGDAVPILIENLSDLPNPFHIVLCGNRTPLPLRKADERSSPTRIENSEEYLDAYIRDRQRKLLKISTEIEHLTRYRDRRAALVLSTPKKSRQPRRIACSA